MGALAYFILPTDAIPDYLGVVGFTDDLGALAAAVATVAKHLKPEHSEKAERMTGRWFGEGEG